MQVMEAVIVTSGCSLHTQEALSGSDGDSRGSRGDDGGGNANLAESVDWVSHLHPPI